MAVTQQLETVIQIYREFKGKMQTITAIDDLRVAFDEWTSQFQLDKDVKTERVGAGGVPAEWIIAPGAAGDRVLLYLHGGGYVVGSMRSYRVALSRMSRASGARVLGLDYRLAPENPFPAPVEDSVAAYRWLLSNGADPAKIVIAGDSAGGGHTVSTLVYLRYLGEPLPAAGVCLSSWTDLANTGESIITNAEVDPIDTRELLDNLASLYMGDRDRRTPLASPLYADLRGLPPLLFQVGTSEILLDDSTRLAERARAAGVDVALEVWDDMIHDWFLFAPILPEGQQAIERIGQFIRQHTG